MAATVATTRLRRRTAEKGAAHPKMRPARPHPTQSPATTAKMPPAMLWCKIAPMGDSTADIASGGTEGLRLSTSQSFPGRRQAMAASPKASTPPTTMPLRQLRPAPMKVDAVESTGEMATSSTQATAHPQPTAKRMSQLS